MSKDMKIWTLSVGVSFKNWKNHLLY